MWTWHWREVCTSMRVNYLFLSHTCFQRPLVAIGENPLKKQFVIKLHLKINTAFWVLSKRGYIFAPSCSSITWVKRHQKPQIPLFSSFFFFFYEMHIALFVLLQPTFGSLCTFWLPCPPSGAASNACISFAPIVILPGGLNKALKFGSIC